MTMHVKEPSHIFQREKIQSSKQQFLHSDGLWYVFDTDGNIEVSGLSKESAEEIISDLCICEPENGWQCAEDKENGEVEEA